jgi:hypothetical protein
VENPADDFYPYPNVTFLGVSFPGIYAGPQLYFQRRQKEIELKKKITEAKKAKFMKEAGGLKYTALHMAGRANTAAGVSDEEAGGGGGGDGPS